MQVGERDIDAGRVRRRGRARRGAAELVNRTLAEDDHVTQFELLTAAAFWELARREVEVAVIEAGLGGRYDATNVIARRCRCSPTSGLEHTRWLGPTVTDIAARSSRRARRRDARARRARPGRRCARPRAVAAATARGSCTRPPSRA